MDVIYLGLMVVLFAMLVALVNGCARLMRVNSHNNAGSPARSPVDL